MDNKECEICSKMTKEKYKHYNLWKTLAIVFICLTALLAVLYFASGSLFTSRTIKYDNDVVIENDGDNNTNKNNGNIIIEKQNDSTGAAIIIRKLNEYEQIDLLQQEFNYYYDLRTYQNHWKKLKKKIYKILP